MASQIWRITGLDLQGPALELSGLGLTQASVRVESGAVLASSFAPTAGSLSALLDGDAQTSCTFSAVDVAMPGFYIEITLESGYSIDGLVLTGASLPRRASLTCLAQEDGFTAWAAIESGEFWFRKNPRKLAGAQNLNPSGLWLLNEVGTTQADIVGTRTATRTGGAIVLAQLTSDGAQAFDPQTTGKVVVPGIAGVDASTFSVVFDMQTTTAENLVVIEHGSDNRGWSIQTWSAAAYPEMRVSTGCLLIPVGSANSVYATNKPVNDGKPHRVVLTFDPINFGRIYVDGVLDTVRPAIAGGFLLPSYNTNYLCIGSRDGASGLPAGSLIANVAIFNRALSAAEIARLNDAVPISDVLGATVILPIKSEAIPQGLSVVAELRAELLCDREFSGLGRIYGTVREDAGQHALQRRVRLFRSRDGMLARETWSAADGSYRFDEVNERYEYDIEAWDHEKGYFTVVANNQLPEVTL